MSNSPNLTTIVVDDGRFERTVTRAGIIILLIQNLNLDRLYFRLYLEVHIDYFAMGAL